jgi:ectoine hydroxylase-related dioxygenase (phytanoyl-CoA dioxygenase family)
MLDRDSLDHFEKFGYLVLENLVDESFASRVISKINLLAWNLLEYHLLGRDCDVTITKDNAYKALAKLNRKIAGKIFDVITKIPELNRYVYQEKFECIAQQLMQSDNVLSPPTQMNLRTDHPSEESFLYPWHTDYSYNFSSRNSLVFWIPLTSVDLSIGSLHVIPGSHLIDHRIKVNSEALILKRSSEYFELDGIQELIHELGETRCHLSFGQGLVFHSNLIHKSGINYSDQIRYTIQSRWFDASSNDAMENLYVGGIDQNNDPKIYLSSSLIT